LKTYHPTDLMAPGYEILFFWVARMILMSTFLLGDIPFRQVVLHGIVRDKQGRKFSKSLDNGIDPLDMSDKYGTDALRFALVFGAAPGNDVKFDEQKVKGMQHFANKLWNISRFILQSSEKIYDESQLADDGSAEVGEMNDVIKKVNADLENFRLHEAAQTLYDFIWYKFADKILEDSKSLLKNQSTKEQIEKRLQYILRTVLKLLHPFMPFVTEHIWSHLSADLLLIQKYPRI